MWNGCQENDGAAAQQKTHYSFSDGAMLCNMAHAKSQALPGATLRFFRHFS